MYRFRFTKAWRTTPCCETRFPRWPRSPLQCTTMSLGGLAVSRAVMALAFFVLSNFAVAAGEAPSVAALPSPEASASGAASWQLVDAKGHAISDRELKGKPSVFFFGFTHCPMACPVALSALTAWIDALGTDAAKVNFVFVTIDPERDTPAELATYLSNFNPRIQGLTGKPDQVAILAQRYGVAYERIALEDGDYSMSHPMLFYLADQDSRMVDSIDIQDTSPEALEKLRRLSRS